MSCCLVEINAVLKMELCMKLTASLKSKKLDVKRSMVQLCLITFDYFFRELLDVKCRLIRNLFLQ